MNFPISPEYLHYLVDGGILVIIWKANRSLNRWLDVMTEYPPHRHVPENGSTVIIYPKGMEPGVVQHGRGKP